MLLCKGLFFEMFGSWDEVKSEFVIFVDVRKKFYKNKFIFYL